MCGKRGLINNKKNIIKCKPTNQVTKCRICTTSWFPICQRSTTNCSWRWCTTDWLMLYRHQLSQPVVGSKGWGAKDSAPHCRVLPSRYTGQCGPNYIQSRLCKICSESRTWWHRRTLRRQQKHEMETVDDPKIITKCYTQFCERQIAYKDMKWTIRGM